MSKRSPTAATPCTVPQVGVRWPVTGIDRVSSPLATDTEGIAGRDVSKETIAWSGLLPTSTLADEISTTASPDREHSSSLPLGAQAAPRRVRARAMPPGPTTGKRFPGTGSRGWRGGRWGVGCMVASGRLHRWLRFARCFPTGRRLGSLREGARPETIRYRLGLLPVRPGSRRGRAGRATDLSGEPILDAGTEGPAAHGRPVPRRTRARDGSSLTEPRAKPTSPGARAPDHLVTAPPRARWFPAPGVHRRSVAGPSIRRDSHAGRRLLGSERRTGPRPRSWHPAARRQTGRRSRVGGGRT